MNTGTISLILIAITAIFSSVTAPLILAHRTERMRREDRQADWDRQDAVAARAARAAEDLAVSQKAIAAKAAEAASLLLAKQQESVAAQQEVARQAAVAAELLLANNERVAATQLETNGKLDVIHTLVNSNMTTAMKNEFDAVTRELAMMREVMELRRIGGQEPSPDTITAIAATEAKMHELNTALVDRAKAQDQVTRGAGLDVITTTSYRAKGAGGEA